MLQGKTNNTNKLISFNCGTAVEFSVLHNAGAVIHGNTHLYSSYSPKGWEDNEQAKEETRYILVPIKIYQLSKDF